MHDREIALWNARMRIYFDANLWEIRSWKLEFNSYSRVRRLFNIWIASFKVTVTVENESMQWRQANHCLIISAIDASRNRLGCRNFLRQSQLQTRWTHIFFLLSLHFFSSCRLCNFSGVADTFGTKDSCQRIARVAAPAAALSLTNMMNPHLFFSSSL